MAEVKEVWHEVYHHGRVTGEERGYLVIDFDEVGEKVISPAFCEAYRSENSEMQSQNKNEKLIEIRKKLRLTEMKDRKRRNILIIYIKEVRQKQYHVVGVDIFTGKTVMLADLTGKTKGYFSESKVIGILKPGTVIQSDFEICDGHCLNILRMTGDIVILGSSRLELLHDKYLRCNMNVDCVQDYEEIKDFCDAYPDITGYVILDKKEADKSNHAGLGVYKMHLGKLNQVSE